MNKAPLKTILLCALGITFGTVFLFSKVQAYIYPRIEGEKAEAQIIENRAKVDTLLLETGKISGKLDAIMMRLD